jgi:tripartite-type tricarboxylate transporter receptor subunit TctC
VVLHKPGGGSILGANYFQKQRGDGLTVIAVSTSTLTSYLFGGKKVKFNPNEWRVLVTNPLGTAIYARVDSTGVKGQDIKADVEALRKAKLFFGAKNKTSAELRGFLAFDLLGFFPTPVFGQSSGKQIKAVLRGEFNLNYDSAAKYNTTVRKWEQKGDVKLIMNLGVLKADGSLVKDPFLGDKSPSLLEAYKAVYGKDPEGVHWEVMKNFIAMGVSASKSLALPPKTSDDVYNTYVTAVKATFNDEAFKKATKADLGLYTHSFGAEAQSIIKFATDMPAENRKWMDEWIAKKFGKTS